MMLRVTLDTNLISDKELLPILRACDGLDVEIAATTATHREIEATDIKPLETEILETMVWGESAWGRSVWGNESTLTPQILIVITSGAQPTKKQRRDAIILEAHTRERRDIFVTADKHFLRHGRREQLENLCSTRIMTAQEFCAHVAMLRDAEPAS
jgi:predicted nucleic acid-binding protein